MVEALDQVDLYRVRLALMVTAGNPLYTAYEAGVQELQLMRSFVEQQLKSYGKLAPALVVLFFQHHLDVYIRAKVKGEDVDVPNFKKMLLNFKQHRKVQDFVPMYTDIPILATLSASSPSPDASGATRPPPSPAASKARKRMKNNKWDARYHKSTAFGQKVHKGKIQDWLNKLPEGVCIPINPTTKKTRCLSFHARGECREGCQRCHAELNETEAEELFVFNQQLFNQE